MNRSDLFLSHKNAGIHYLSSFHSQLSLLEMQHSHFVLILLYSDQLLFGFFFAVVLYLLHYGLFHYQSALIKFLYECFIFHCYFDILITTGN